MNGVNHWKGQSQQTANSRSLLDVATVTRVMKSSAHKPRSEDVLSITVIADLTLFPRTRTLPAPTPIPVSYIGTVENHGNTEITETVIFVKCRDFAKIPCLPCFLAKMPCFYVFTVIFCF